MRAVAFRYDKGQSMIIKKAAYNLFPDEKKNILYVVGGKVYAICLKTGKELFSFSSVSNPNQILWSEDRKLLVVKSTVGQFAIYNYGDFTNILHKFKLPKVINTDSDFVLYKNKLYGIATSTQGLKLMIINLENMEIKQYLATDFQINIKDKLKGYIPYNFEGIYNESMILSSGSDFAKLFSGEKVKNGDLPAHLFLAQIDENDKFVIKNVIEQIDFEIFPKTNNVYRLYKDGSYEHYYKSEKFDFTATYNYLEIIPKEAGILTEKKENDLPIDSESYIRENGISKQVLETYGDEEILHGGFFWALDRLEEKQDDENIKAFLNYNSAGNGLPIDQYLLFVIGLFQMEYLNGGYSQYFQNKGNTVMIDSLLYALKTIGALETFAYVEKCDKLEAEGKFEEIDEISCELTEDYIGKTIEYLRKLIK